MFLFKFISLIYICFVYSSLFNDDEQYHIYVTELNFQPLFEGYCKLRPLTLAIYCLRAFRHLAKSSKDYRNLYLNFIHYEMVQAYHKDLQIHMCQDTKLMVPNGDKLLNVPMKHMVCHRGPVIVRTDEPNENKYYDDISIYITKTLNVIILKRIDRENHKLLAMFETHLICIKVIKEPIKTPQSTFTMEKIEEHILKGFPENKKHILEEEISQTLLFKKICYMIFSRPEYKDAVKFLPSNKMQHSRKRRIIQYESMYIFANMTRLTVELHSCNMVLANNDTFRLMKGSAENSVVVVMNLPELQTFFALELVENITLEYLDYQIAFLKVEKK